MRVPPEILRLLRCPSCGAVFDRGRTPLRCTGPAGHRFGVQRGFLTLGLPPLGKYDADYAARYAALWAFGAETLHLGFDEPLYRTVSSFAAEALAAILLHPAPPAPPLTPAAPATSPASPAPPTPQGPAHGTPQDPSPGPVIVDCGCGVGRVMADCAALAPRGFVLGFDGSPFMLGLAARIVCGSAAVEFDLSARGFGKLSIPGRARGNVHLLRGDVERLPLADACADLALSINVIDRLAHGPERAFAECHRILRPGGHLVFSDPLDFTEERLWQDYGRAEKVIALLERLGFELETWFDRLPYREILDGRGSFEEFTTLVALARKVR